MSWSKYAEFLAFAVVLVLIPGPDFAVVTKNTQRATLHSYPTPPPPPTTRSQRSRPRRGMDKVEGAGRGYARGARPRFP